MNAKQLQAKCGYNTTKSTEIMTMPILVRSGNHYDVAFINDDVW